MTDQMQRVVTAIVDRASAEWATSARCVVSLDEKLMADLGSAPGDFVEVLSPRGLAAVGRLAEPAREDRASGAIRLDRFMRQSIKARLDERVELRATELDAAPRVVIAAPIDVSRAHHLTEHLQATLARAGTPCVPGTKVYVTFHGSQAGTVYEIVEVDGGRGVFDEGTELEIQPFGRFGQNTEEVSLEDIGGLAQQVRLVRELVQLPLQFPFVYRQLGIRAPRGIIFYGPPGSGKTHLARALAHDVSASFYFIDGPSFVGTMQGETESNLRRVFDEASHHAPSVVFIDELDSIAPHRGQSGSQSDVRAVTTLLTLMDGLEHVDGVVVIATTNRIDAVDVALRRPGRFDREIFIGPPSRAGRAEILGIHTREMPLSMAARAGLDAVADVTHGFVGADLMDLCREAGLNALRRVVREPEGGLGAFRLADDAVYNVEAADFDSALKRVRPSALREVLVSVPDISWSDIGGLDGVQRVLRQLVERPLVELDAFREVGLGPVDGILLHGPPGTGKTMLVHALAAATGVNFVVVDGPEIFTKWLGESEEAIRHVFKVARQLSPAIVFFDQLEALAPHRGGESGTRTTERVVSQLLSEVDALRDIPDIVVVGATNRIDLVDAAVLQPGRFGAHIHVPLPDAAGRSEILRLHLSTLKLEGMSDLGELCEQLSVVTEGWSGAQLRGLVSRARLHAATAADHLTADIALRAEDLLAAAT